MKITNHLNDPKIRIRTQDELNRRKENFLELCNILDQQNIFYFIQGGTLLGARREKKFIEWDWDVEISVFDKDLNFKFDTLLKKFVLSGFSIAKCNKFQNPKIDLYKDDDYETTSFTIMSWKYEKDKKKYSRGKINIPEYFFKQFGNIEFYEKKFNTPYPIEDYLTYQYGDWKTKKRTSDKEMYMTSIYYKRDNYILKFLKNFFKNN